MNTKENTEHPNKFFDVVTLRDYYAGKAMQGFIVSSKAPADSWDSIATNSYEMADAMIKQRNNQTEEI